MRCHKSSEGNGSYRQQRQDRQDPSAHLGASVRPAGAPCVSTSFGKEVDRAARSSYNNLIRQPRTPATKQGVIRDLVRRKTARNTFTCSGLERKHTYALEAL